MIKQLSLIILLIVSDFVCGQEWKPLGNINFSASNARIFCEDKLDNLYITGDFKNKFDKYFIAKFNGYTWQELSNGNNKLGSSFSHIKAMCTDKNNNLYAYGHFSSNFNSSHDYLIKWNGNNWQVLDSMSLGTASDVNMKIDKNSNIYISNFLNSNGTYTAQKWNNGWTNLSLNSNSSVLMTKDTFDNVYFAGFRNSSNQYNVYKLNGTSLTLVGGTNPLNANDYFTAFCSDNQGNLFITGNFKNTSNKKYVAKWNGSIWTSIGGNNPWTNGDILSLSVNDSGHICASGSFTNASSDEYVIVYKGGSVWDSLPNIYSKSFYDLTFAHYNRKNKIYCFGNFTNSVFLGSVAIWDNNKWNEMKAQNTLIANNVITAMCRDKFDNIYVGGIYTDSADRSQVFKYNKPNWSMLGYMINSSGVYDLVADKLDNIYAAISYNDPGIGSGYRVMKWNGSNWSIVGGTSGEFAKITTMCTDTLGNIYIAGEVKDTSFNYTVKKWNGTSWTDLGKLNANGEIYSICSDKRGYIYSCGNFSDMNSYKYIARWNGTNWSQLWGLNSFVPFNCLITDKNNNLYAAGNFADNNGWRNVHKWNDTIWSQVGFSSTGLNVTNNITRIAVDSSGKLYASGEFKNNAQRHFVAIRENGYWKELNSPNELAPNERTGCLLLDQKQRLYIGGHFSIMEPYHGYRSVMRYGCDTLYTPTLSFSNPKVNLCVNDTTFFFVTSNYGGTNPKFQWKKNGVNISGGTDSILKTSILINGDSVMCEMISNYPCKTDSVAKTKYHKVYVAPKINSSISISFLKPTVCKGDSLKVIAQFQSGGLNPQFLWYKNNKLIINSSDSIFHTNSLANLDTISCILKSNAQCVYDSLKNSNKIVAKILDKDTIKVSLVSESNPFCSGDTVLLRALVNVKGTAPIYKWYKNKNLLSITSDSFLFITSPLNGDTIHCQVVNNTTDCLYDTVGFSNKIILTELSLIVPIIVIKSLKDTLCFGELVSLTSTSLNGGISPKYQWYKNGIPLSGAISDIYSSSSISSGDIFSCRLISSHKCAAPQDTLSNKIRVVVLSPTITAASISTAKNHICAGNIAQFYSVTTNAGSNPVYEWRRNSTLVALTKSFSSISLNNNDTVYLYVTSSIPCASPKKVLSNKIVMKVSPTIASSITIINNNPMLTAPNVFVVSSITNLGTNAGYQWQDSTLTRSWQNIFGAKNSSINYSALAGHKLRCILTSKDSCASPLTVISNVLTFNGMSSIHDGLNSDIFIYPNPTKNKLILTGLNYKDNWEKAYIVEITGRIVLKNLSIKNQSEVTIDLGNIETGSYILTIISKDNLVKSFNFIKE